MLIDRPTRIIAQILLLSSFCLQAAPFADAIKMPEPQAPKLQSKATEQPIKVEMVEPVATEKPETAADIGEPEDEKPEIYLNFDSADLSSIISYMAELKEINYIPNPKTAGVKVSLAIREPLTIDEAWKIFQTILEMGGFSIIKVGDVHKIVIKNEKHTEPLPVQIGTPYQELPDSDETIRFVTFFRNIPVSEIESLIKSMLSQNAQIIRQDQLNGLVITDRSYNIKSAMRIATELDNSGYQETVTVLRLKHANASDVQKLLESIIKKPDQSSLARLLGYNSEGTSDYFAPSTKIIAEDRTNSLILLGEKKSLEKVEEFITEHIDKSLKAPYSPVKVYELQHADATQIKEILEEVTSSNSRSKAAQYGGIRNGVKYFNAVRVEADKVGNRLLVSCTDKQDWKLLKKTILDLDKPQPQVAIETLIVQIDQTDNKELGGQMRNTTANSPIKNIGFQGGGLGPMQLLETGGGDPISLLGNLIGNVSSLAQGATALTLSNAGGVWAAFKAIKEQKNVSLISQPFVTVANRVEGRVSVGEQRRIVKETYGGSSNKTSFESVPVATEIKFTPQINPNGIINLKVKIDLSEFLTDGGNRSKKKLDTNVTVASGQVLVLGGFVKTKVTESGKKSPIFGDIPILGWLAKNKKRSTTKSYIFLFVCPTIVKPRQSPGSNLYTKMKLHSATKDIEKALETEIVKDPIHNWFFNPDNENYSHKVVDFSNARYQPTTVDIRSDPYYRSANEEPHLSPLLNQPAEVDFQEELTSIQSEEIRESDRFIPATVPTHKPQMIPRVAKKQQPQKEPETLSLEQQREKLKRLVAGSAYKPPTKPERIYNPETARGQFKQTIATSPTEDAFYDEQKRIKQVRKDFKNTLFVSSNDDEIETHNDIRRTALREPDEKQSYRDYLKTLIDEEAVPEADIHLVETKTEQSHFKDDFFDYPADYDPLPQSNMKSQYQTPKPENIDKRQYLQDLVAANPIRNPFAPYDDKELE